MNSPENIAWLAFDIGAKKHAYSYEFNGKRETGMIDNAPSKLRAFINKHMPRGVTLRVLAEATGVYYLDVMLIAHDLGAQVMVINPRVAHHFAQALNQRSKTDRLDANMLLECLMRMPFEPWQPPRIVWLQLRSFGRFLVQLTDDGVADRNRLHALNSVKNSSAFLRRELRRKIANNERMIERIRAQALALIESDSYLKARFEALTTIKGMGETSAVSVLSELITLPPTLSSRACVCHSGLDPRIYESGTSVHKAPRISRRGNKYLRRALFFPALSAARHDQRAKAFKARLEGRGKKKMQANVAIMRKMLTAAWVMMKDPQPYDPARLYADI